MSKYCITRTSPNTRLALGEKGKFWENGKRLKVKFLGGSDIQKNFVKETASEWSKYCNINFDFTEQIDSDIRIAFQHGNGSWSYVGTDCLGIPKLQPTMNFGWLDRPVVLHEFGHALGLGHEHQNPDGGIKWDVDAVIDELSGSPNNWDIATIMWNVIDPYDRDKIIGTELDPLSIMMYAIPNEWTLDDFETGFNDDLSDIDKEFISTIYPLLIEDDKEEIRQALKKIFTSVSDIKCMRERMIVEAGKIFGLDVNQKKYTKGKNAKILWDKLKD